MYFDQNGDPPTGYDIVTWIWRGPAWSLRVVGSYTPDSTELTVNATQIEWISSSGTVSLSREDANRSVGGDLLSEPVYFCVPPPPRLLHPDAPQTALQDT